MSANAPAGQARRPRLSIIVPIYNVEAYLDACLESVAAQTFADFEVIMVDDGSTDGSAEVARRWAEKDKRFRLVQQDNHGLGHARNTGVANAVGEYYGFLDSDDLAPEDAYRLMVETLDKSGSDFASGNVERFNSTERWQAAVLAGVTDRRKIATHVSRSPELLKDHLAHNKVWRASFYRQAGVSFPVGVLYEDVPTTIPAHFRARAVDVIPETVILWRVREGDDRSITQSRTSDSRHVQDRVVAVTGNSKFFADHGAAELKTAYDAVALNRDLRFFLDLYEDCDDAHRETMREAIGSFVAGVSAESMRRVKTVNRIKYALLERGASAELIRFLRLVNTGVVKDEPVVVEGGRALLDIDARRDPALDLPAETFDVTDELDLVTRVTDVRVSRTKIEIDGWAFIDRLAGTNATNTQIEVWLEDDGKKIPVRVTRRPDVGATELAKPQMGDIADAGFTAEIPVRRLRSLLRPRARNWAIMVAVSHGGVRLAGHLDRPLTGRAERPVVLRLRGDWWLRVCSEAAGMTCRVRREHAMVTGATAADGAIVLTLALGKRCGPKPLLELRPSAPGGKARTFPVERDAQQRDVGRVRIPGDSLVPAAGAATSAKEEVWSAYVRPLKGARAQRLHCDDGVGASVTAGDHDVATRRTRAATFNVLTGPITPRLRAARWVDGPTFEVEVAYPGAVDAVVLSNKGQAGDLVMATTRVGDVVTASLNLGALPVFGETLPIRAGTWDILVRTPSGILEVVALGDTTSWLPVSTEHAGREHVFTDRKWHRAVLSVSSELPIEERGPSNQLRLRTKAYPALRGEVRDAVLYETYTGKQFSDSPRAIFEELRDRAPHLEHLVVVRDQQIPLPPGVTGIPRLGRAYQEALARSRYVVANTHLPAHFERSKGQVVVQTWHGSAMKKIGLDIDSVQFSNVDYHAKLLREVPNWDHLISPNPFNSTIFRRALAFEGNLLETGSPRNDIFHRPDRDAVAARVRQRLGISADRKIVLYAPTWRDDLYRSPGRYRLDLHVDLAMAARALGDDYAIVFRKHSNVVDRLPSAAQEVVIDASDYPDVQDLLLVTDVLISDYSSLMCDFANTGRPMLFYTYDLAKYRDKLRGFYFDFEAEVPGPLILDEAELIEAIRDADKTRTEYDARYQKFVERFCPWDDGGAGRRVVDAVFANDLG